MLLGFFCVLQHIQFGQQSKACRETRLKRCSFPGTFANKKNEGSKVFKGTHIIDCDRNGCDFHLRSQRGLGSYRFLVSHEEKRRMNSQEPATRSNLLQIKFSIEKILFPQPSVCSTRNY